MVVVYACVRVCVRACMCACVRVSCDECPLEVLWQRTVSNIFWVRSDILQSCNIKQEFYETLQAALRDVEDGEKYILLGDFNAQIGSCEFGIDTDDPWWEVRGPHGFGTLNSSGRELLNVFSSNNATVCDTWFRKRDIHKGNWRHPRSGQWKCIDFIDVAQARRQFCLDVRVLRSAECGSDHNMLSARFALRRRFYHFPRTGINHRRFDIGKFCRVTKDQRSVRLMRRCDVPRTNGSGHMLIGCRVRVLPVLGYGRVSRFFCNAKSGYKSNMCPSIRMENGELCGSADEQVLRWHRHFSGVLQNVTFKHDILDDLLQQPVSAWLGEVPTIKELHQAIHDLSMKRAAGEYGILPEMVRQAGPVFEAALLRLLHRVCEEENVPRDWPLLFSYRRRITWRSVTTGVPLRCSMWLERCWLDLFRIACVRWRRRSYLNPSVAFGRAVDALTWSLLYDSVLRSCMSIERRDSSFSSISKRLMTLCQGLRCDLFSPRHVSLMG